MSVPVSLITTSYSRDFEACRLLCDSIDAYVTGYSRHYIVVAPDDLARFSVLSRGNRVVVDASRVLDLPLLEVPLRWRGRRYFWSWALTAPIYGWHLQQLRKIAMTLAQAEPRALHLDSDICFVRPFDVADAVGGERLPMRRAVGGIDARLPRHMAWWRTVHDLLGLAPASFPGDDFIGPMVTWDRSTVQAMVERIESTAGRPWAPAIARTRQFSEYLLYGAFALSSPEHAAMHRTVTDSPCAAYWSGPPLDAEAVRALLRDVPASQSAVVIQSSTSTPVQLVRECVLGERVPA